MVFCKSEAVSGMFDVTVVVYIDGVVREVNVRVLGGGLSF